MQSFLKPTASLPYASFVATRQPGHGYSARGDGTDYPRSWSGQTPTLAYLSALAIASINPEMAQGILRNYLAVQRADGWIDWKPGLAGQQQEQLCLPVLARMAWGIWQYSQDDDFLRETFPGLLRFFERWLTCDAMTMVSRNGRAKFRRAICLCRRSRRACRGDKTPTSAILRRLICWRI